MLKKTAYSVSARRRSGPRLDLSRLELFVRIAQAGSLAKAAVVLDVGPTVLSRQLAALEVQLGGRLLLRTGRGVIPTPLGERMIHRARDLLDAARAIEEEIDAEAGICRGTVHIACIPSFATPLLTRVVRQCRDLHPGIRIHVAEGLSSQVEQWLADGSVDLGLVLRQPHTQEEAIAMFRLCLVGPPGDRLTRRKSLDFKRLDGVPLLQPAGSSAISQSIMLTAREHGVKLDVVAEIDSIQLQKSMVAAGLGYALLSVAAVQDELKTGRLSATPIVDPEIVYPISLVDSTRKAASAPVHEVSRIIRQVARELSVKGVWGVNRT